MAASSYQPRWEQYLYSTRHRRIAALPLDGYEFPSQRRRGRPLAGAGLYAALPLQLQRHSQAIRHQPASSLATCRPQPIAACRPFTQRVAVGVQVAQRCNGVRRCSTWLLAAMSIECIPNAGMLPPQQPIAIAAHGCQWLLAASGSHACPWRYQPYAAIAAGPLCAIKSTTALPAAGGGHSRRARSERPSINWRWPSGHCPLQAIGCNAAGHRHSFNSPEVGMKLTGPIAAVVSTCNTSLSGCHIAALQAAPLGYSLHDASMLPLVHQMLSIVELLVISYLLCKNKNEQFQTETYKLFLFLLFYSILLLCLGCKYYSLQYKANVIKCKSFTELTLPQNFYLISSLFALSCNNFITFYLSIEFGLVSLLGLVFVSYLPTIILGSITFCIINMVFTL